VVIFLPLMGNWPEFCGMKMAFDPFLLQWRNGRATTK
jgi:hypothetical protein